jgi:predicted SPOUT superfamily RNA methylase MTH1
MNKKTISIAISAEHLCKHNKNLDQLTHAIYMIARNACLFQINEIIILGNKTNESNEKDTLLVGSLFQFFITPRYLVQETFCKSFQTGKLPKNVFNKAKTMPLIPTIMEYLQPGINKDIKFREGISINKNILKLRSKTANGKVKKLPKNVKTTRFVQIGLNTVLELDNKEDPLPLNVRVSVDMINKKVVSVQEAWKEKYCGYVVRAAMGVVEVFTEAPWEYDIGILIKAGEMFSHNNEVENEKLDSWEKVSGKMHSVIVVCPSVTGEEKELFDQTVGLNKARVEDGAVLAMGRFADCLNI